MTEFLHSTHSLTAAYLLIFIVLVCTALIIQHFVKHSKYHISKYLPEAAATIAFTSLISAIIRFAGGYSDKDENHSNSVFIDHNDGTASFELNKLGFPSSVFYFLLLPPILFNSGYHLKRSLMFANFGAIISLSVLGTMISVLIVTIGIYFLTQADVIHSVKLSVMEIVAFAALISSTDPVATLSIYMERKVDPTLFYIVFGESCLNDAVALTLFTVSSSYIGKDITLTEIGYIICKCLVIFIGSAAVGYIFGILTAFIFKYLQFNRKHHSITATSILLCSVYIPFLLCEVVGLSGIVAIFFSGISSRRYINKNLNKNTVGYCSFTFNLVAYVAETACFTLLGLSVFALPWNMFKFDFILVTAVLIIIGRVHVYPLLGMINFYRLQNVPTTKSIVGSTSTSTSASKSDRECGFINNSNNDITSKSNNSNNYNNNNSNSNNDNNTGNNNDAGDGSSSSNGSNISSNSNSTKIIESLQPTLPLSVVPVPVPVPVPPPVQEYNLISVNKMHMIFFAGLRGCVAYSCANIFPSASGNK